MDQATGTASWVDVSDTRPTGWGRAVRLGVPSDTPDPILGVTRVSLNEASNVDVHPASYTPPGPDCNDATYCRRTVFRMSGTAPSAPGIHRTTWRLVDETRAWFGPEMWLSYRVTECAPPPMPDPEPTPVLDADDDGSLDAEDCADADPTIHPGADDLCEDMIDSDCDGIDPACETPVMPTPDPDADDPGFDWSRGEPVHGRPTQHRISSSCSATPGDTSSPSLLLVLGLLAVAATRLRRRP